MPEESDLSDQQALPEQPTTAEPPVEYPTVREALQSTIDDQRLKNHAEQLYKPGATVGDGGTAAAVYQETETGEPVNGRFHDIKADNHSRGLGKLDSDSSGLNTTDREIAKDLKEDLDNALANRDQTIASAVEEDYSANLQAAYSQQPPPAESSAPTLEVSTAPEPEVDPTPGASVAPSQGS